MDSYSWQQKVSLKADLWEQRRTPKGRGVPRIPADLPLPPRDAAWRIDRSGRQSSPPKCREHLARFSSSDGNLHSAM
jgi:hypothetical protein